MGIVHSTALSVVEPGSFWNHKNLILLAGLAGLVASIAYLYFRKEQIQNRMTPSPPNYTRRLPFDRSAAGVIMVNAPELKIPNDSLVIECAYQGKTFFIQQMTPGPLYEAVVSQMPYQEKMTVRILQGAVEIVKIDLQIDQEMGIYEITKKDSQWTVERHFQLLPQPVQELKDEDPRPVDEPLFLVITPSGTMTLSAPPESYVSLINQSHLICTLFFEIIGCHPDLSYSIPIRVLPYTIRKLPCGFLRKSWEYAYQSANKTPPPDNAALNLLRINTTFS
jgi:hypothetical protein